MDPNQIVLNTGYQDGLELDIAIIGAGVSGLYTGYRLLTEDGSAGPRQNGSPRVQIFEMSDRVGGRLDSVVLPGMTIAGELGGMRYMTSQQIVTTLIETVFADQLTHVDFPMGDPATHYFYMRRQRFRANSWAEAQSRGEKFETRYYLNPDDVGYSADQLFNKIVYDVLMADPWVRATYGAKITNPQPYDYEFQLTAQDWDAIKPVLVYNFPGPYEGRLVNDMGFWNLIKDQVSEEGYQFLADAGGYYSNTINWNAAEAFPYMVGDFSLSQVAYRTIEGGYDQIADVLAEAFQKQPGAEIWGLNRLVCFQYAPPQSQYRYQLTIYNQTADSEWTVYANAIVLAMPRRSLELLDQNNFFFGPDPMHPQTKLHKNIDSIIVEPAYKLLMGFTEPWWKEDFGATAGESITDLPMRQCYYFGTDPADSHSLFLASYNDMSTVPFWSALERDPLYEPKATELASEADVRRFASVQAPRAMVAEVMEQVRELHGLQPNRIPDPYITYFKDWSEDPYGGGYHAWKARVAVKDVMPFMRQPYANEAIHICGEAYSDQQGWVEGALCEAEKMLQEHFGLQWPGWLPKDYYLGW
ncbi:MAG TPA: FAD-dependent oxidoreductase [Chloroflexia bacterium]|jgi:hypothetical protein